MEDSSARESSDLRLEGFLGGSSHGGEKEEQAYHICMSYACVVFVEVNLKTLRTFIISLFACCGLVASHARSMVGP
jgi:hypothetical protein